MSGVPLSLEAMFAMPIIYDSRIERSRAYKWKAVEYPSVRCRINDIVSDNIEVPNDAPNSLHERIWDHTTSEIEDIQRWFNDDIQRWFNDENKYKLLFDDDYNLMIDLPLFELLDQRKSYEADIGLWYARIEECQKDPDADQQDIAEMHTKIEEAVEYIEDIDKSLVDCARLLPKFLDAAENMKGLMDGYFVVVDDEGNYDLAYVHDDIPEGYHVWTEVEEIERCAQEAEEEIAKEAVSLACKSEKPKKEGLMMALNSAFNNWKYAARTDLNDFSDMQ